MHSTFAFMTAAAVPLTKPAARIALCTRSAFAGCAIPHTARPHALGYNWGMRSEADAYTSQQVQNKQVELTDGFDVITEAQKITEAEVATAPTKWADGYITQAEVEAAQALWGSGVVKIGTLKDSARELEAYTEQFLNERYAFDMGKVLFKPTKCASTQFRDTKMAALSYFIAGSKKLYAEDTGFAVTPWTKVRFENTDLILENGRAVAMGNYYFTDTAGKDTKVEYTFGYKKVDGQLKIDLHHSSLPFSAPAIADDAPVTQAEVQAAQLAWANGVVKIGTLKQSPMECEKYTDQFLNERYAFDMGKVLFKPTKCAEHQFRDTKPAALSYFIAGHKKQFAEDSGFAVTPWTNIRFENTDFILENNGRAIAMGNYFFTDTSGKETKVEYTFGYKRINGNLKIDLHHSSIPFPAAV